MRNLPFVSFLLVALLIAGVSCGKKLYSETRNPERALTGSEWRTPVPSDTTLIYKTGVDAYGRYISGLLIIKSSDSDDYRLVFTTEMGMKLFDFEFREDKFLVHYCFDKLNKKPVIRLLEKDFSMMLFRDVRDQKVKVSAVEGLVRYLMKRDDELWRISIDPDSRTPVSLESLSPKGKDKRVIKYVYRGEPCPSEIHIDHANLDLKMRLDLLKR